MGTESAFDTGVDGGEGGKARPQKETARLCSLVVGPEMLSPGLFIIEFTPF